MSRIEHIGDATLYLGDCRDWLSKVPPCFLLDALITDPPYGVGFLGKVTKDTINRPTNLYADDSDTFFEQVIPAIHAAIRHTKRAAIFSGIARMRDYPQWKDIGGIVCPAGSGRSSWGFGCFNPVLFYGSYPRAGSQPTVRVSYHPGMHITGENNGHPCPKPLEFMLWAVQMASLEGESVFDPFMGSGTTGVACANLGRKFIGIEIDPGYFDIACRRIEEAYRQPRLFEDKPPKPEQLGLPLDVTQNQSVK